MDLSPMLVLNSPFIKEAHARRGWWRDGLAEDVNSVFTMAGSRPLVAMDLMAAICVRMARCGDGMAEDVNSVFTKGRMPADMANERTALRDLWPRSAGCGCSCRVAEAQAALDAAAAIRGRYT